MRPLKLELENFLSHRSTRIDFAGITAAVVQGPNGAGKSSLPSAIAFALYGKGRGRPDDLVTRGATACRVRFEFELAGQVYAVERQRDISGRGTSDLSLCVALPAIDLLASSPPGAELSWKPIGGATIAENQTAIEQLLGLTFEQWKTTSYVAQNEAAGFTNETPAGRKQLLADLLGLEAFDRLHDAAHDGGRALAGETAFFAQAIEDLERGLAKEAEARERLGAAEARKGTAAEDVAIAEVRLQTLEEELTTARVKAAELAHQRERLRMLQEERGRERARLQAEAEQLASIGDQTEQERRGTEETLRKLRSVSALTPVLETEAAETSRWAEALAAEASELLKEAAQNDTEAAAAGERARVATERLDELRARMDTLSRATDPRCPTCSQPLSEEHRTACLEDAEQGIARAMAEVSENNRKASLTSAMAVQLRDAAAVREREAQATRAKAADVQRGIERAKAAEEQIPDEENRLASLHRQLEQVVTKRRGITAKWEALSAPSDEEAGIAQALQDAGDPVAELDRTGNARIEAARDLAAFREILASAERETGAAEQALQWFDVAREELEDKTGAARATAESRRLHETLARLYGRDCLPALVIENVAIPQIEAEANRLLRILDDRFTVVLESQRAKKTGGIKDTLDIMVISAEYGELPLANLSGGERSCVDIALHVALARLVAHRAGVRIQTLIVDEGTANLDGDHLQRTVQALHHLTEEFDCLIYITHQVELGAAFPQRIEVSKVDGSSRVDVLVGATA